MRIEYWSDYFARVPDFPNAVAGVIGDKNTIINQILAFEPQRMLSIRNTKAPEGFPHAELFNKTWSVIYFDAVDDLREKGARIVAAPEPGEAFANADIAFAFLGFGLNAELIDTDERAALIKDPDPPGK